MRRKPEPEEEPEESYSDESSSEEEEVRYNVLEREKRVTAGKRYSTGVPAEPEKDITFWGTAEHDTWMEVEDDSSVSFDSLPLKSEGSISHKRVCG